METAISRDVLETILAACAADPAREACGLLFGDQTAIDAAEPTANVATETADSFEIDPRALFHALRTERAGGRRLVGHYHSHPNGRPDPSARDAAAAEPGRLWLIVADGEARLWRAVEGGAFVPIRLRVC